MKNLVDEVMDTHGGMDLWKSFNGMVVHLKSSGEIWKAKGADGLFADGIFEAGLHRQQSSYRSLESPFEKSVWHPGGMTLQSGNGSDLNCVVRPRELFKDEEIKMNWTKSQLHYFANYTWWNYFTSPFNFKMPGFETRELEPWEENGEIWRRLEVAFPDYIQTHNAVQTFYFDRNFLLRRHDYSADILQPFAFTQYMSNYEDFQGVKIPAKTDVYLRNPDGTINSDPVMVSIDVQDVRFSKDGLV
ncbi:hypothetical protein IDJ75_11530 [Mucilaginibacter rigui]|uniref:Uncharacterized protein n=1 Tax=Mucilaginibacter rigui TaxID=534635 RepID=A0ABR7X5Q0_9SPHI|nr:hypothetical protein [Mucilaginibacter rigui]MBD1385913.1 hypothetical protein [Mucilaginibacter rigui]